MGNAPLFHSHVKNLIRSDFMKLDRRANVRVEMRKIAKATVPLLFLLLFGLGAVGGGTQGFAQAGQAVQSVQATHGNCDNCGGCEGPCMVQVVCGYPCVPSGLLVSNIEPAIHVAKRPIVEPSWRHCPVCLGTPTPPPRS